MVASGMMGDGIGVDHVATRSGRRTKRDHQAGLLRGKREVLISQCRRSTAAIHRNHDDGEIKILPGLICDHH